MGLLSSHRRLFHLADAGYVAPPLLFAVVSAAGLLRIMVVREPRRALRLRLRAALGAALALLIGLAYVSRAIHYGADERVPIPGTGGMLSARPEISRELAAVAAAVRARTRENDGLVVLPEGGVLNYLAGRANPMRQKIAIPGYLRESNEKSFIRELERALPAAVVILKRPAGEYGRGLFGQGYGRRTRDWIESRYFRRPMRLSIGELLTISKSE
jgi:hypothetical protein